MGAGRVGEFERDVPVRQPRAQMPELDIDDLLQVRFRERMEHDGLVHAVQELGPEAAPHLFEHGLLHTLVRLAFKRAAVFQNAVAADIGGHDRDRVLEVDRAALAVGEPAVVQDLEHDIEHVVMRLLDLVE